MSNSIFPTLRGMSPHITRTPMHNTLRKVSQIGSEVRARLRAYPRYQYKLSFEYLLDKGAQDDDLHTLMGFYNRMGGSFDSFLLYMEEDHSVNDQLIGVGDGNTFTYQLVRSYGGFVEPVFAVKGTPVIMLDHVVYANPADYTINSNGLVTFRGQPYVGAKITWTGEFYHRVIFDEDSNDFDRLFKGIWSLQTLKLLSDRG